MFPNRLLLSVTLIYTYLILIYARAMSGTNGFFDLGDDTLFRIAAHTMLISCSGSMGMAIFAFGFRPMPAKLRRYAPLIAAILCAVGELSLYTIPSLFVPGVILSITGWGFLTAYLLFRVATEVPASAFGQFIGVSYGLSACLQFTVGTMDAFLPNMSLTQMLSFICLIAFAYATYGVGSSLPAKTGLTVGHTIFNHSRISLLLGVALISMLMGFSDSVTVAHHEEFAPAFPLSRLFYAAGLFFFGWLADRHFSLLPVTVLLSNAFYFWFRALDSTLFLPLSQIIEMICSAPTIILLTVGFLHKASHSERPERWASMGRLIGLPLTSLGLALGVWLWPEISMAKMFAACTTLLLIAVVLLYRVMFTYLNAMQKSADARLALSTSSPAPAFAEETHQKTQTDAPSTFIEDSIPDPQTDCASPDWQAAEPPLSSDSTTFDDAFAAYCSRYDLTAKESEVLSEILKGLSVDEIAEAQFISKRTVRFHVSNLLRKTGNKTRITMIAHFYQTANAPLLPSSDDNDTIKMPQK